MPVRHGWACRPVVPDARRDHPALTGDARHLAKACDGIGHEMHHELGECGIEADLEGQALGGARGRRRRGSALPRPRRTARTGRRPPRVGPRLARPARGSARQVRNPTSRTRASSPTSAKSASCGESWRVQAHEPVIGLSGHLERHRANPHDRYSPTPAGLRRSRIRPRAGIPSAAGRSGGTGRRSGRTQNPVPSGECGFDSHLRHPTAHPVWANTRRRCLRGSRLFGRRGKAAPHPRLPKVLSGRSGGQCADTECGAEHDLAVADFDQVDLAGHVLGDP